jgi:hypothetical protein
MGKFSLLFISINSFCLKREKRRKKESDKNKRKSVWPKKKRKVSNFTIPHILSKNSCLLGKEQERLRKIEEEKWAKEEFERINEEMVKFQYILEKKIIKKEIGCGRLGKKNKRKQFFRREKKQRK